MQGAFRRGQLVQHGKMILAGLADDVAGQARLAPSGQEIRLLAMELLAFVVADREDQASGGTRQIVNGAVPARHFRVHAEGLVEIGQPDRLEVVEPADGAAALDQIGRRASGIPAQGGPIRGHRHRRQVTPRRMAGDEYAIRIAAIFGGVAPQPQERRASAGNDLVESRLGRQGVADRRVIHAGGDEGLGQATQAALVHHLPVAAMNKGENWRTAVGGRKQVEPLAGARPVGEVEADVEALANRRAIGSPFLDHGGEFGHPRAVVVLRIERRLVVFAE